MSCLFCKNTPETLVFCSSWFKVALFCRTNFELQMCNYFKTEGVPSYLISQKNNLQEYNAKLSDFGLAKDGPVGDKSHVSTRIMGTYGYAAPEYIMTGNGLLTICL